MWIPNSEMIRGNPFWLKRSPQLASSQVSWQLCWHYSGYTLHPYEKDGCWPHILSVWSSLCNSNSRLLQVWPSTQTNSKLEMILFHLVRWPPLWTSQSTTWPSVCTRFAALDASLGCVPIKSCLQRWSIWRIQIVGIQHARLFSRVLQQPSKSASSSQTIRKLSCRLMQSVQISVPFLETSKANEVRDS